MVTNLSLATTRRYRTQGGQTADETEWHRVVFVGRLGEVARDYLSKGRQIYVEGRLRTREYTDKSGNRRWVTEVVGTSLQMLGRRDDGGAQSGGGYSQPASARNASAPKQSYQSSADSADPYNDSVPF